MDGLPSTALAIVLPSSRNDPAVPIRVPVSRAVGRVTVTGPDRAVWPPAVAWTTAVPVPLAGARYRPAEDTDPTPADRPGEGGRDVNVWPNWSTAEAVNCSVRPSPSVTPPAGVIVTPLRVWRTVTSTLLVAVAPVVGSVIVAVNVYAPAAENVAVVAAGGAVGGERRRLGPGRHAWSRPMVGRGRVPGRVDGRHAQGGRRARHHGRATPRPARSRPGRSGRRRAGPGPCRPAGSGSGRSWPGPGRRRSRTR